MGRQHSDLRILSIHISYVLNKQMQGNDNHRYVITPLKNESKGRWERKGDYKQVIEGKIMWLDGDKTLAENVLSRSDN